MIIPFGLGDIDRRCVKLQPSEGPGDDALSKPSSNVAVAVLKSHGEPGEPSESEETSHIVDTLCLPPPSFSSSLLAVEAIGIEEACVEGTGDDLSMCVCVRARACVYACGAH